MREHQFGRIENLPVRDGQPILHRELNVVRVAHLGGENPGTKLVAGDEFELKRSARDLFAELARLRNGTVISLEFRHGLPFLVETSAAGHDVLTRAADRTFTVGRCIPKTSWSGEAYFNFVEEEVLRIPDDMLNSAIYLYPNVGAAERGEKSGGSGFIVGVPSAIGEGWYNLYAVTNRHVIEGKCPVVRFNLTEGNTDIASLEISDWTLHPDGEDVAVCPINLTPLKHQIHFIPTPTFLTRKAIEEWAIGVGDEVFLIGRFLHHDGRIRNQPSARFGSISMMPGEPVQQENGHLQESFLVELHSIGGYSGSPVFVYIPPFSPRVTPTGGNRQPDKMPVWFLGLDWGHLPGPFMPITDRYGNPESDGSQWGIRSNAGMMGVVPSWRLDDLLNLEKFKQQRAEEDKRGLEGKASAGMNDVKG